MKANIVWAIIGIVCALYLAGYLYDGLTGRRADTPCYTTYGYPGAGDDSVGDCR